MSDDIWGNPELAAGGDYFKFERDGDYVDGLVNVVRLHRFDDGSVAPQLLLTLNGAVQNGTPIPAGEDRTVTAGQIRLKLELAAQKPNAGDRVLIRLLNSEKRAGGKTLKHFEVKVQRNAGTPNVNAGGSFTQPAAAAPAPAPAAPPAFDQGQPPAFAAPAPQQGAQPLFAQPAAAPAQAPALPAQGGDQQPPW